MIAELNQRFGESRPIDFCVLFHLIAPIHFLDHRHNLVVPIRWLMLCTAQIHYQSKYFVYRQRTRILGQFHENEIQEVIAREFLWMKPIESEDLSSIRRFDANSLTRSLNFLRIEQAKITSQSSWINRCTQFSPNLSSKPSNVILNWLKLSSRISISFGVNGASATISMHFFSSGSMWLSTNLSLANDAIIWMACSCRIFASVIRNEVTTPETARRDNRPELHEMYFSAVHNSSMFS